MRNEYLRNLTGKEKEVLMMIIKNFGTDSAIVLKEVCETTGKADSTVRSHLKRFTEKEILIASGKNKGRRYILNRDIFL